MRCANGGWKPSTRRTSATSTIEEGQPLTFTASFDTVPAFDPGDCRRSRCAAPTVGDRRRGGRRGAAAAARSRGAVRAGRGPRRRSRRHGHGRSVRRDRRTPRSGASATASTTTSAIELGGKANPPGFDEQLLGLDAGATKDIHDPLSGGLPDWGARRHRRLVYSDVKGIKRRVLPELDDEFAKDLGRVRNARRAARAGARGPRARSEARRGARDARRADEAARGAAAVRGAARRSSSARSTGASRSSRGG